MGVSSPASQNAIVTTGVGQPSEPPKWVTNIPGEVCCNFEQSQFEDYLQFSVDQIVRMRLSWPTGILSAWQDQPVISP